MLHPGTAVIIDCETTDLPGVLGGKVGYSNLRNRTRIWAASLAKASSGEHLSGHIVADSEKLRSRLMHDHALDARFMQQKGIVPSLTAVMFHAGRH
jgi:hypothetical protein